jgi:hypothetical protein
MIIYKLVPRSKNYTSGDEQLNCYSLGVGILVDLAGSPARFVGGFEPAPDSVRWIKMQGKM